jgi:nucleotide-binding universal stress UspA family protein
LKESEEVSMAGKAIIAAYDGSGPAIQALQWAADLARAAQATVVAVYVVPPYAFPADFYGQGLDDLVAQHRAWAQKLLEEALEKLRERGCEARSELLLGGAADEIAHLAEVQDAWMVVVGSRGRGGVSRTLLGSVADRLVHVCKKPVLVVR